MKRSDWIVLVIVLLILAGIAIGVYLANDNKLQKFEGKDDEVKENKFSAISRRMREIEDRVKAEVTALNMSKEMESALNRKLDSICLVVGSIIMAGLLSIVVLFYYNGMNLLNATLCTAGLAALTFPGLSIVCWKNIEFNKVIETTRGWVKKWLDKKYGHNPDKIQELSQSISQKTDELKLLSREASAIEMISNVVVPTNTQ